MNWLRLKPVFNLASFHCASKYVFNKPRTFLVWPSNNTVGSAYSINASFSIKANENDDDKVEKIIQELCKDDPTLENKLRVIMLEVEVMRQDGRKAPENNSIKIQNWEHILSLPSRSARYKYLLYLWKNEKKEENLKIKKEAANKAYMEMKLQREKDKQQANETTNEMEYSLIKNSMFLRIYDKSINAMYNSKLMHAMQFGEKLVIDCSYDKYMNLMESTNAAKQLTLSFAENRMHKDPFDLHYCNCDLESITMRNLHRHIPPLNEPWFPLHIHTESYIDFLPKESLVYLTPHCRDELTAFDPNATYIIGCMVDKVNNEPLSLAKAKEQNIKMAKFPLDRYLQWGSGSGKSLTINQVLNILLDLKLTGDWEFALRHVPRRKIFNENYANKNSSKRKIETQKPRELSYTSSSESNNARRDNVNQESNYFKREVNRKTNYTKNDHFNQQSNYIKKEKVNQAKIPTGFNKRKLMSINSLFDDKL